MPRGGRRPGAGRPKGSANKRTREVADAAAALGNSPLEYLLKAFANPQTSQRRRDRLAEVCMPYMHAKLNAIAAIDASANTGSTVELRIFSVPRGCQVVNGVIRHPDGSEATAAETEFHPFTPTEWPQLTDQSAPEAEPLEVLEPVDDDKVAPA